MENWGGVPFLYNYQSDNIPPLFFFQGLRGMLFSFIVCFLFKKGVYLCSYLHKKMDNRIVSTAVLTLSRQQEEFLARYRTHESQQAYFASYGLGVTPFFRGGGGSHGVIPPSPEPELPYDYAVEYISNDAFPGSVFIDTLIESLNPNLIIKAKIRIKDGFGGQQFLFGGNTYLVDTSLNNYLLSAYASDPVRLYFFTYSRDFRFIIANSIELNTIIDISMNGVTQETIIGGIEYSTLKDVNKTREGTIKIFSFSSDNYSIFDVFFFQIYDLDSLVLDLIPVVKSGIGCMYDKVSGKLFFSEGTGSFTFGKKI